jgi:outer membrane protein TolC
MSANDWRWRALPILLLGVGLTVANGLRPSALGQEQAPSPRPLPATSPAPFTTIASPAADWDQPLPINLATALQLTGVRSLDIALATERTQAAVAGLAQARALWLPSLYVGPAFFRHDGLEEAAGGTIFNDSRNAFMLGAGPNLVLALSDAIFAPLAAQQVVQARKAGAQAVVNDTLLAVAEAYFNVQQARGEMAGAQDTVRRSEELVQRTEQLAGELALPMEAARARADLAEHREDLETASERWRVASADLVRLLHLDPVVVVQPVEPPHLQITLVSLDCPVDDLIPVALTNRPELAAQQALVQAALERLRQERIRPLVPSVLLRGASTPVTGTLAGGLFGGGSNSSLDNWGGRSDIDLQVLWQLQNLGFGNHALVKERRSEHEQSVIELFRIQDRVAAEVAQAHAQARSAAARAVQAESGLRDALDSVQKNFEGLQQTRRAGNVILLVVRPQEAVAAVQALARAYTRYFSAVADYNRAQFRLYRALGKPAQLPTPPALKDPGYSPDSGAPAPAQ